MQSLKGLKLDEFPVYLSFLVHLEYFDGPLCSLFRNKDGDYYCYSWCDVDDFCNRWLVFRVTQSTLKQYIEGIVSLHHLILHPVDGFLYVLDILDELEVNKTLLIRPNDLPTSYIPDSDSYYSFTELNSQTTEQDKRLIYKIIGHNQINSNIKDLSISNAENSSLEMIPQQRSIKLKRRKKFEYDQVVYYKDHPNEFNTYLIQIVLKVTLVGTSLRILQDFSLVIFGFIQRIDSSPLLNSSLEIFHWIFRFLIPLVIIRICWPAFTTWSRVKEFKKYKESVDKILRYD